MSGYLQNFDLTNEFNILRLICGLFFIPHIYAKFYVPEALGFFKAAKFNPPKTWMYISSSRSDLSSQFIRPRDEETARQGD